MPQSGVIVSNAEQIQTGAWYKRLYNPVPSLAFVSFMRGVICRWISRRYTARSPR